MTNRKLLDRWAAMEASKFLVNTRLKSHFGGANQTFENLLRIVADAAKTHFSPEDLHNKEKWGKIASMRGILELIDQFDRQLFLAYEGSAASPSSSLYDANSSLSQVSFPRSIYHYIVFSFLLMEMFIYYSSSVAIAKCARIGLRFD